MCVSSANILLAAAFLALRAARSFAAGPVGQCGR